MNNHTIEITNKEFELFSTLIFKTTGISIGISKKFLIKNRLQKQLKKYNFNSFMQYYEYIQKNKTEQINMLNLMTTNETYFFREDDHFRFIEQNIMPHFALKHLRVWSAASSVGAEAYSIAMLLHGRIKSYEIIGTDINSEVIKKASQGLCPIKWMKKIPDHLKHQFCLVGKNQYKGWFLVDRALLKNVQFMVRNLLDIQKDIGSFDVIFLRNVLIYFDKSTKKKIIQNVISNLKVGGYFFISLTEHIAELNIKNLKQVQSSIFQKV